jgi:hypothetical protein
VSNRRIAFSSGSGRLPLGGYPLSNSLLKSPTRNASVTCFEREVFRTEDAELLVDVIIVIEVTLEEVDVIPLGFAEGLE